MQDFLTDEEAISDALKADVHFAIKKVTDDYEKMKFNTAIAALMTLVNSIYANGKLSKGDFKAFLLLLNPVAPHITEELWELCKIDEKPLYQASWPEYDEKAMVKDSVEIAVQVCGKLKAKIVIPSGLDKDQTEAAAMADSKVKEIIGDNTVKKIIVVPGRLINIVI
jgi:leucyl-tRNA synthetase